MWQIAQTNPLSRPSFLITKSLMPEIRKVVMLGFLILQDLLMTTNGVVSDYNMSPPLA